MLRVVGYACGSPSRWFLIMPWVSFSRNGRLQIDLLEEEFVTITVWMREWRSSARCMGLRPAWCLLCWFIHEWVFLYVMIRRGFTVDWIAVCHCRWHYDGKSPLNPLRYWGANSGHPLRGVDEGISDNLREN